MRYPLVPNRGLRNRLHPARWLLGLSLGLIGASCIARLNAFAADPGIPKLPFDREMINRYSLDHLPRSLSIRQNQDVWLGYDLERGKLYKAWQSPSDGAGLKSAVPRSGVFVVQSQGQTWYEDTTEATWQLKRSGETVPLEIRYLGCSHRENVIELTWELRHDVGKIELTERIDTIAVLAESDRIVREIRARSLAANEVLLLPPAAGKAWALTSGEARIAPAITDSQWYRLLLPALPRPK